MLLAAFEGWNDATEAASTALRYLSRHLGATRFATIDPEEFYDFTCARPTVRLGEETVRVIEWPTPTFEFAAGAGRDVVLLHSPEPALKWRTFTREVIELCTELGVELVVGLGALLADVPHTRPIRVAGSSADPALAAELGLHRSRYEGPTGIVGILQNACAEAGIASASLWASTPHYLHQTPSPRAALALVERAAALLAERVDPIELQIAAVEYDRQVDDLVASEADVAEYVRRLEEDEAADMAQALDVPPEALAAEVERYLREQRGS